MGTLLRLLDLREGRAKPADVELVFKAEDAVQAQDFVKRMKKAVESGGGHISVEEVAETVGFFVFAGGVVCSK